MTGIRLTHIGGPTVLIEAEGWRILTDPTFDPPGQDVERMPAARYTRGAVRRRARTALGAAASDRAFLAFRARWAVPVALVSDRDREEFCVVARRAQPALVEVLHERAKVGEAAALDPQGTVGAPPGPEANLIHAAGSALE